MKLSKIIFGFFLTFTISIGFNSYAEKILLIPQDDRPVSLAYTVSTAEKAGYTIITPPTSYLSGRNRKGSPDKIWNWLKKQYFISRCMCIIYRYTNLWRIGRLSQA